MVCVCVCVCDTGTWTQGLHLWATPPALFLWRVFQDKVSWTICPSWLRSTILLISASWVARITGVSHQHPAKYMDLEKTFDTNCQSHSTEYAYFNLPLPTVQWKLTLLDFICENSCCVLNKHFFILKITLIFT
jgi:hypothetical protein